MPSRDVRRLGQGTCGGSERSQPVRDVDEYEADVNDIKHLWLERGLPNVCLKDFYIAPGQI